MFLSGLIVSHLHRAPLRLPDPGSCADAPGAWDNKTARRRFQGGALRVSRPAFSPSDFSPNSQGSLPAAAAGVEDVKLKASRMRLTSECPCATLGRRSLPGACTRLFSAYRTLVVFLRVPRQRFPWRRGPLALASYLQPRGDAKGTRSRPIVRDHAVSLVDWQGCLQTIFSCFLF